MKLPVPLPATDSLTDEMTLVYKIYSSKFSSFLHAPELKLFGIYSKKLNLFKGLAKFNIELDNFTKTMK